MSELINSLSGNRTFVKNWGIARYSNEIHSVLLSTSCPQEMYIWLLWESSETHDSEAVDFLGFVLTTSVPGPVDSQELHEGFTKASRIDASHPQPPMEDCLRIDFQWMSLDFNGFPMDFYGFPLNFCWFPSFCIRKHNDLEWIAHFALVFAGIARHSNQIHSVFEQKMFTKWANKSKSEISLSMSDLLHTPY